MSSQSSPKESPIDSDEEVPAVQLCCLSFAEMQTLDFSSTADFSILFDVLAHGNEETALAAVTQIYAILQAYDQNTGADVIRVGGVDVLHQSMKHTIEPIRVLAIKAITFLITYEEVKMQKICKSDCIVTLVELVNSDESWKVKKNAIKSLGILSACHGFSERAHEEEGITAILSNLNEDDPAYMRAVCNALYHFSNGKYTPNDPSQLQIAAFIMSHLDTFDDDDTRFYIYRTLYDIVSSGSNIIKLNDNICASLIQSIGTPFLKVSVPIIETITYIILTTNEYTELFLEHDLLSKIQELTNDYNDEIYRCTVSCLSVLSVKTTEIVNKVVHSGVISQLFPISTRIPDLDVDTRKDVTKMLGNVCDRCSSPLIPQLLEMPVVRCLIQGLWFEIVLYSDVDGRFETIHEAIAGLRGIIRHYKEISDPEGLKSQMDVEKLAERCRELVNAGIYEVEDLLNDLSWVLASDMEADEPKKKHKSE